MVVGREAQVVGCPFLGFRLELKIHWRADLLLARRSRRVVLVVVRDGVGDVLGVLLLLY